MTINDVGTWVQSTAEAWLIAPFAHWALVLNGEYAWSTLHVWDVTAFPLIILIACLFLVNLLSR